jgi:hypothetical protein
MTWLLSLLIFAGCLASSVAARDSVTIKSDPSDVSRPVSTLLNQIRQLSFSVN